MEFKTTDIFTMDVINEIRRIEREEGLTPENLIENAKKKRNPLHGLPHFKGWDNEKMINSFLLQQARIIINQVMIIIDEKEIPYYEAAPRYAQAFCSKHCLYLRGGIISFIYIFQQCQVFNFFNLCVPVFCSNCIQVFLIGSIEIPPAKAEVPACFSC